YEITRSLEFRRVLFRSDYDGRPPQSIPREPRLGAHSVAKKCDRVLVRHDLVTGIEGPADVVRALDVAGDMCFQLGSPLEQRTRASVWGQAGACTDLPPTDAGYRLVARARVAGFAGFLSGLTGDVDAESN